MKNTRGNIAIITVLIFTAFIMLLVSLSSKIGFDRMKRTALEGKSIKLEATGAGCSEEALYRLKNNASYSGGTLNLGEENCTIVISDDSGFKKINITSVINQTTKKIEIKAQITTANNANNIEILSWKEV